MRMGTQANHENQAWWAAGPAPCCPLRHSQALMGRCWPKLRTGSTKNAQDGSLLAMTSTSTPAHSVYECSCSPCVGGSAACHISKQPNEQSMSILTPQHLKQLWFVIYFWAVWFAFAPWELVSICWFRSDWRAWALLSLNQFWYQIPANLKNTGELDMDVVIKCLLYGGNHLFSAILQLKGHYT